MAKTALVIIDMLNTYDHQDADLLVASVGQALPAMVRLLEEARERDLPVIYVNDDFGKWRSHHGEILDVTRLVLCGQVTEQCVLCSALDAHIRHLSVTVAEDAVASIHQDLTDAALRMMETNTAARIVPASRALG